MSQQGQVRLERIYLKDASFESPRSPAVFGEEWQPEAQMDVNTSSRPVADDRYEVVLRGTITMKFVEQESTVYIAEVQQAGVFLVTGLDEETLRRVVSTVCPSTLFPYLRETVDSMVVKGGFPALHLAPVNFDALYAESERQRANAATSEQN